MVFVTTCRRGVAGRGIVDPRSAEEGGLGDGWGQATVKRNVYDWYEEGDTRREGTFIDYAVEAQKSGTWVMR